MFAFAFLFVVYQARVAVDAAAWPTTAGNSLQTHRDLQSLSGNETKLPLSDIIMPVSLSGIEAVVTAYNITCSGIRIDEYDFDFDVLTRSESDDTATLFAKVHALSFALNCHFLYKYESSLASGNGTAVLVTTGNTLATDAIIMLPGTPEETLTTSNCNSTIQVNRIEFLTVEPFAPLLEGVVKQPEIGNVFASKFCDLVSKSEVFYIFFGTLASTISKIASKDVLLAEASLVVPSGTDVVDFQSDSQVWPASGVNLAIQQISPLLGRVSTQNDMDDLYINHLLRDILLDDDGAFILNIINGTVFKGIDQPSTLQFHTANITGLDRFTRFDDLTVLSAQTLQANASIDSLYIRMFATLETQAEVEEVEVVLNVSNLDAVLAVMVAIDASQLGNIPLGALLGSDTITNCFLSSIIDVKAADMIIDSLTIQPPASQMAETLLSAGIRLKLDSVVRELVLQVIDRQDVSHGKCEAAPFSNPGSPYVDFRDLLLDPQNAMAYGGSGTQPYGNITSSTKSYFDEEFLTMNTTGQLGINSRLVVPFTEENSGVAGKYEITEPITLFDTFVQGSKMDSRMGMAFNRLTFESLESFTTPVAFMQPVYNESSEIVNTVSMSRFRVTGVVDFQLEAPGLLRERLELEIGLDVDSISVAFSVLARVVERSLLNFPIRDILDVNCWLATIPAALEAEDLALSLAKLAISIGDVSLSVGCSDCSSSFDPVVAVFSSESESLNSRITSALTEILSDDNLQRWVMEAPPHCPHHKDYDPSLQVKEKSTTSAERESPKPSKTVLIVLAVCLTVAFSATLLYYSADWTNALRYKKWLRQLPKAQGAAIRGSRALECKRRANIDRITGSMSNSSHVPLPIKYLIPLMLVASSVLYVAGVCIESTHAHVFVTLFEQDVLVVDFKLAIWKLASDFWNGGGTVNAVLTVLTSMVWPNFKNISVFVLWYTPSSVIGSTTRFNCLWWLNAIGKWCMCVVFVLMISTTAFRFTITSPIESVEGDRLYGAEMLIVPVSGIYLWAIGQILSQVSGQVFMYYYTNVVSEARKRVNKERRATDASEETAADAVTLTKKTSNDEVNDDDSVSVYLEKSTDEMERVPSRNALPEVALSDVEKTTNQATHYGRKSMTQSPVPSIDFDLHSSGTSIHEVVKVQLNEESFCRDGFGTTELFRVHQWVNPVIVLMSVCAVVALLAGCVRPAFSFEATGFVADMATNGSQLNDSHSVISLAILLVNEASRIGETKKVIGLGLVMVLFIAFVVFVPILHVGALLTQWFYPLTLDQLRKVNRISELLQVWQLADVFLLALALSAIQLSALSEFVIGKYCDSLGAGVQLLENAGVLSVNGDTCYAATGSIKDGAFFLMVAVCLVAAIRLFVFAAANDKLSKHHTYAITGTLNNIKAANDSTLKSAVIGPLGTSEVSFADRFRIFLCSVGEHCDESTGNLEFRC